MLSGTPPLADCAHGSDGSSEPLSPKRLAGSSSSRCSTLSPSGSAHGRYSCRPSTARAVLVAPPADEFPCLPTCPPRARSSACRSNANCGFLRMQRAQVGIGAIGRRNLAQHALGIAHIRGLIEVGAEQRRVYASAARLARILQHRDTDLDFDVGQCLGRCLARIGLRQIESTSVETPVIGSTDLGDSLLTALRKTAAGDPKRRCRAARNSKRRARSNPRD